MLACKAKRLQTSCRENIWSTNDHQGLFGRYSRARSTTGVHQSLKCRLWPTRLRSQKPPLHRRPAALPSRSVHIKSETKQNKANQRPDIGVRATYMRNRLRIGFVAGGRLRRANCKAEC